MKSRQQKTRLVGGFFVMRQNDQARSASVLTFSVAA